VTVTTRRAHLERRAVRLAYATIGWNSLEALISVGAGIVAGSIALLGFGLDSAIEVLSAAAVLWQLHGVGDDRERRALRIIAFTFFGLAAYVSFESLRDLVGEARPDISPAGIAISAAALVVMPTLAWAKRRTGHALGSRTILADAVETAFCAWLAAVTLGGLLLNTLFGLWWADPLAGLVIAAFAVKEGREAFGAEDDD
jgi:divalent metal cation (Fe/Co/Zn/Cd) transporter